MREVSKDVGMVASLFGILFLTWLQIWDIRDGMCKQTFTGHESDINAVAVCRIMNHLFT